MHFQGPNLIIPFWQGTGFFVSIALLGFAFGHKKAVREELLKQPDFDKTQPPWKQPAVYAKAKLKARDHLPAYWYFGNVQASFVFSIIAVLTDYTGRSPLCQAAEVSCAIIGVVCALMYFKLRIKSNAT
jgi:hypothetical protein